MNESRAGRGASVAIAGGGVIGTSIAWRLAQRGFRVTLFEKGSLGGEASWAAAGMLALGGEVEAQSALMPMASVSRELYPTFVSELEELSGLAIDYQECGALDLAYSDDEWQALQARAAGQAQIGIASDRLETEDVSRFSPRIRREGLVGALFYPLDAIVNAREMMVALAAACKRSGVTVVQDCRVDNTDLSSREVIVTTRMGKQAFDSVVVAAGAWSDSIEVKGGPPLPRVEPVKGHLIGYQQPEHTCPTIVRRGHQYLLQRASGLLICGSSMERVGFDRQLDPEIVIWLSEGAAFLLPHLRQGMPAEIWTGFRPASDTVHIGCWGSGRLYLAYGHHRNGILLAPVTAQRIADEISANLRMH